MGNLCSIYHAHFDRLVECTKNYNKAVFLDKCIFWWQISKYTLEDGNIWFTRTPSEMAKELSLCERSIGRYLKDCEEKGLLVRTCKLSASSKSGYKVSKRLYIRVTEKLLNLIQTKTEKSRPSTVSTKDCSFINQDVRIEKDKMSESINKEKHHNSLVNSTVSLSNSVDNKPPSLKTPTPYPVFKIEQVIGERMDERTKNYIKGMMANLQQEQQVHFSSPEQTFAEIIFTLTNQQQLKQVDTLQHKIQIIAKLLREKRWRTPKGFYNHADYGQYFKRAACESTHKKPAHQVTSLMRSQSEKTRLLKQKQDCLEDIKRSILSEKRHLALVLQEQQGGNKQALLDSITRQLKQLEEEATQLDKEIKALELELVPAFEKGKDVLRNKTQGLNQLQDKAEALRVSITLQFEQLCKAIEALPKGHKDIETQQQAYDLLQTELIILENTISELEYDLYAHQAA